MRKSKNITIIDDGNELKFKITALSALSLQRWCVKAGIALASSGLLETDIGGNFSVEAVIQAISSKGLAFLGRLNSEEINKLIIELVCGCSKRLSGASIIDMSESELDNTFTDIKALFELEKEVFAINFSFMASVSPLTSQQSSSQTSDLSDVKISIPRSHP